jgi:hypothetical protein
MIGHRKAHAESLEIGRRLDLVDPRLLPANTRLNPIPRLRDAARASRVTFKEAKTRRVGSAERLGKLSSDAARRPRQYPPERRRAIRASLAGSAASEPYPASLSAERQQ